MWSFGATLLLAFATAALAQTLPGRMTLEILKITPTSATARFKQYKRVNRYRVTVELKDSLVHTPVYSKIFRKHEKHGDNFYYIDVADALSSGNEYEMKVFNDRKDVELATMSFTTKCDEYAFQCYSTGIDGNKLQQACLSAHQLCDGITDCADESDEDTNDDGTCANSLPEKPGSNIPTANRQQAFWSGIYDKIADWAGFY